MVLATSGTAFDAWNGSVTLTNDDIFGVSGLWATYDSPDDPSQVQSQPAGDVTVTVRNCILHGKVGSDGQVTNDGTSGSATINIDFSNFGSIVQSGGTVVAGQNNQNTTAPTYVKASAGNYREAAGWVTIDAGLAQGLGTRDLAGDIRTMGRGPDIGAFEYVTKGSATTLAASAITSKSATLDGAAHNGALGGTYHFQYGLTSKYGSATPARPLAALRDAQHVAALTGQLRPKTKYHFRLVVTNSAGSAFGGDLTFATPR